MQGSNIYRLKFTRQPGEVPVTWQRALAGRFTLASTLSKTHIAALGTLYQRSLPGVHRVRMGISGTKISDLGFFADRFISPSGGSDSPYPTSGIISQPWATFSYAASQMSAGQILACRGGTYTQRISGSAVFPSGSNWANATQIIAYPSETPILRPSGGGGVIQYDGNTASYVIFDGLTLDGVNIPDTDSAVKLRSAEGGSNPVHHIRIINCTITNKQTDDLGANGILLSDKNTEGFHEIINCNIHTCEYGIYCGNMDNLIQGNQFHDNSGYGIHHYSGGGGVHRNRIHKNRIWNNTNTGAGILLQDGDDCEIYNNVIFDNDYGIRLQFGVATDNCKIINNTVFSNNGDGVDISASETNVTLRNNIVYGNSPNINDSSSGGDKGNNLTTDPTFVNEGTRDLHIQSSSAAKNTGQTRAEVTDDYDGLSRPQGSAYDIGAYEFDE